MRQVCLKILRVLLKAYLTLWDSHQLFHPQRSSETQRIVVYKVDCLILRMWISQIRIFFDFLFSNRFTQSKIYLEITRSENLKCWTKALELTGMSNLVFILKRIWIHWWWWSKTKKADSSKDPSFLYAWFHFSNLLE